MRDLRKATIGVVGAGTMGAGIAEIAARGGHKVLLYDAVTGAAERGRDSVIASLDRGVSRGRLSEADRTAAMERLHLAERIEALAPAQLVVEAVFERLDIKRALVADLESLIADDAVIASNTSSLSITAIAAQARRPERIAGMHFFNPAPVMELVEIVHGLATAEPVVDAL